MNLGWVKKAVFPADAAGMQYRWEATRPCVCGSNRFATTRFDDVVKCAGCGLLYSVSTSVENPIARRVPVDGSTDSTAS